jgi:hypothetical protein
LGAQLVYQLDAGITTVEAALQIEIEGARAEADSLLLRANGQAAI